LARSSRSQGRLLGRAPQGVLTDLGMALCLPPGGLACRLAVILVIQAGGLPTSDSLFLAMYLQTLQRRGLIQRVGLLLQQRQIRNRGQQFNQIAKQVVHLLGQLQARSGCRSRPDDRRPEADRVSGCCTCYPRAARHGAASIVWRDSEPDQSGGGIVKVIRALQNVSARIDAIAVTPFDRRRSHGIARIACNKGISQDGSIRYLAALGAGNPAHKGGAKHLSPTDPAAAWNTKGGRGPFGYFTNYMIDTENAVIVDVEATPARYQPPPRRSSGPDPSMPLKKLPQRQRSAAFTGRVFQQNG
jgi:hypothetical protein